MKEKKFGPLFDDEDDDLDYEYDEDFKDFLKEFDRVFKSHNPDDDPFDDDLPQPGTPLHQIMQENGIYHTEQRKIYSQYDSANIGCSIDNPIVISVTEDYVHWEYELLEYILRPSPYRFVDYDVLGQALITTDGKSIDRLTVEVSKHPILSIEELANNIIPEKEVLGTEDYFFDVTAGIKSRIRK